MSAAKNIINRKLTEIWYKTLKRFIPENLLALVFEEGEFFEAIEDDIDFISENFGDLYKILSSGQNILIFILTEIISEIRFNSLILYDEPETHLHPNAISLLMQTLFEITSKYNSFCIIGTHSPLVIQELFSRNISILDRDNNIAIVRKLELESFGENLTAITEEVFGRRDIDKSYVSFLQTLINQKKTYDEILSIIESENVPTNLNIKLLINALLQRK